jgi:Ca-activated chloride channel homolog
VSPEHIKLKVFHRHIALLSLLLLAAPAFAQKKPAEPLNRILFVFDASQSMYGRWDNGMKIDIAKKLLNELLDSLEQVSNLDLALRVYGHQSQYISGTQRDCKDTKLEVPFNNGGATAIRNRLKTINPNGTTPIAYSLEQTGKDFPACPRDQCRNMIILITDGIEECDGDPCAVSAALQRNNIILKPFIIGVGLDLNLIDHFRCMGNVFDASNESAFRKVLNVVIAQALNPTSVQVNLLNVHGQPVETDVNMTFFDMQSGRMRYNLMHTMNHRGTPDTLTIDPMASYRIKVHSIPPVEKDSIVLIPGIHNVVGIDAPQGDLILKVKGKQDYKHLQVIVRQKGKMETLNVQAVDQKERYLVGKYDLEVLSTPRILIPDVDVSQSHTTTIEIPQPGMAHVMRKTKGAGDVFLKTEKGLEWTWSLSDEGTSDSVVLQPGDYKCVFRPAGSKRTFYTVEKDFKIESGKSQLVELY